MFARKDLSKSNGAQSSPGGLPQEYSSRFKAEAQPGESPLAWLKLDLNANLRFDDGLVVLTDRRVIAFEPHNGKPPASSADVWPLYATTALTAAEHGGVGSLELFSGEKRLAR